MSMMHAMRSITGLYFLLVSLSLLATSTVTGAFEIPEPDGPYLVHVKHVELVDTTRNDPYAPNNSSSSSNGNGTSSSTARPQQQPRRLMTSVFSPIEAEICEEKGFLEYMPFATAVCLENAMVDFGFGNGTLSKLQLPVCKKVKASSAQEQKQGEKPVRILVFSHGLADSRLMYSALASSMASKGWTVVSIDHTYDSCAVQFPDGQVVYGIDIPEDDLTALGNDVRIRSEDMAFVIQQLRSNSTDAGLLSSDVNNSIINGGVANSTSIQAWGHSLGGATAFLTALNDPSGIPSAVNMDGELFPPVTTNNGGVGAHTPALLFGSPIHNLSSVELDPSWPAFWNSSINANGSKSPSPVELVTLEKAAHNTFTDLALLAAVLKLERTANLTLLVGSIDGYTARRTVTSVLDRWFSMTINGTVSESLCKFPGVQDITITNSSFCPL